MSATLFSPSSPSDDELWEKLPDLPKFFRTIIEGRTDVEKILLWNRCRPLLEDADSLWFWCPGKAEPKGSKSIMPNPRGRPFLVEDNRRAGPWMKSIVHAGKARGLRDDKLLAGPIDVMPIFVMRRPKSCPKRLFPAVKPDGDKLDRCVWDALTGLAWVDDAQVVAWSGLKLYETPTVAPGVLVGIREIKETQ